MNLISTKIEIMIFFQSKKYFSSKKLHKFVNFIRPMLRSQTCKVISKNHKLPIGFAYKIPAE